MRFINSNTAGQASVTSHSWLVHVKITSCFSPNQTHFHYLTFRHCVISLVTLFIRHLSEVLHVVLKQIYAVYSGGTSAQSQSLIVLLVLILSYFKLPSFFSEFSSSSNVHSLLLSLLSWFLIALVWYFFPVPLTVYFSYMPQFITVPLHF